MAAVIAALAPGTKPAAYTLDDMAADAVGLLDALGIARAHIVGASMGGMIAQLVAADYPERMLSLTSIMSTTGNPDLPRATAEAMAVLNGAAPTPWSIRRAFSPIRSGLASDRLARPIRPDEAQLRERAAGYYRRAYYPVGFLRQYAAVIASPRSPGEAEGHHRAHRSRSWRGRPPGAPGRRKGHRRQHPGGRAACHSRHGP